jgi:hypothetical protein
MNKAATIDAKLMQPFHSMAKALEMAEVPFLIFIGTNRAPFVEQASALLNATVLYTSQKRFEEQMQASLPDEEYLFVVIDQPLAKDSYGLIHGYLAARDVMGADNSELETLGVEPPAAAHRLVLLTDRAVFEKQHASGQHSLSELCTRIAVS